MKKITSLIAILLLVIIGAWVYAANKFEQFATEQFLPMIKQENEIITADSDSVVVEKFKFRIKLQNASIFPKSENFAIKTASITVCYNPITDKIKLSFDSDKISIGTGDNEIYILSKEQIIKFNRPLIEKNFDNIDITFSAKNPVTYLAKNDTLIASAESSCSKVTSELKNNTYSINITTTNDQLRINPEARYSKSILDEFAANSELAKINNSNYLQYYYDIMSKTGPADVEGKYSLQINDERLKAILSALFSGKDNPQLIFESFIKLMEENYSVSANESLVNKALDHSWSLDVKNDNGKITTDLKLSCLNNYTDEQKQEINNLTKGFLVQTLSNMDFNVSEEDVLSLSGNISDMKKLKLALNIAHDVKSDNSDNSLKLEINDFSTELKGEVKDKIYHLNAKIDTPSLLIYGMTKIHDESLKPIFAKSQDKDLLKGSIFLDQIMQDVKENGFEAISVFHKKDNLGENDTLQSDIIINLQNFEFKVNNKGMLDILTDEKIIKFLQGMPRENKDNEK
jgi:hypothetical protein